MMSLCSRASQESKSLQGSDAVWRCRMSYKLKILQKKPPKGWEMLEPTLEKFEEKMKEAIDDPQEGKRKAEATWMVRVVLTAA